PRHSIMNAKRPPRSPFLSKAPIPYSAENKPLEFIRDRSTLPGVILAEWVNGGERLPTGDVPLARQSLGLDRRAAWHSDVRVKSRNEGLGL
ncbi:MAG: hypothetical protein AAB093_06430, partial [Nitrospirota bacterium]